MGAVAEPKEPAIVDEVSCPGCHRLLEVAQLGARVEPGLLGQAAPEGAAACIASAVRPPRLGPRTKIIAVLSRSG